MFVVAVDLYLSLSLLQGHFIALAREQYPVVELRTDTAGQTVELDEVDYKGVVIVVAPGLNQDVEIVPVQVFAGVVEGDEMRRIEMQFSRLVR